MENRVKSKNFKYLALALVVFTVALIVFLIYNHFENERIDREAITFKENLEISFNSPAKVSDFIETINGELIEDTEIDTEKLGEQTINFDFINIKNKKRSREITISVIDDIKPQIHGNNSYTVYQGYKGKLTDLMLSVDNIDDQPKREIIGEYDLEKTGSYSLIYKITDANGNSAEKNFILNVIQPPQDTAKPNSNSATTLIIDGDKLADIIKQYKTAKTKIGVDVSEWQGKINWAKVQKSGIEFAMIRLGYQKGYDGELVLDPYFEQNIKAINKLNLPVGVYFFSYAKNHDQAREQAEWILDKIKDYNVDLGIAYDWENWNNYNTANMSIYTLNRVAETFLNTIKNAGYHSLNYSSKNYLDLFWNVEGHDTWLAQYYHKPTYEGDFSLWQMTDTGLVDGIDGYVDLDIMYSK